MTTFLAHRVACQQLRFERDEQCLFEPVSFAVQQSECIQILGANGCGKSTLLRMLAGLASVQSGTVLYEENNTSIPSDQIQTRIHYLGHKNGIRGLLTAAENIELHWVLQGQTLTSSWATKILAEVGLRHCAGQTANTLSAGQQRRLSLARLLISARPVWILDEPITALDSAGVALFHQLLDDHLRANGIALIATHQMLAQATHTVALTNEVQHV